jgi:hypothetical protein
MTAGNHLSSNHTSTCCLERNFKRAVSEPLLPLLSAGADRGSGDGCDPAGEMVGTDRARCVTVAPAAPVAAPSAGCACSARCTPSSAGSHLVCCPSAVHSVRMESERLRARATCLSSDSTASAGTAAGEPVGSAWIAEGRDTKSAFARPASSSSAVSMPSDFFQWRRSLGNVESPRREKAPGLRLCWTRGIFQTSVGCRRAQQSTR